MSTPEQIRAPSEPALTRGRTSAQRSLHQQRRPTSTSTPTFPDAGVVARAARAAARRAAPPGPRAAPGGGRGRQEGRRRQTGRQR